MPLGVVLHFERRYHFRGVLGIYLSWHARRWAPTIRYNYGMPRIFLGNFDFERELARSAGDMSLVVARAAGLVQKAYGGPIGPDFFWAWLPIADPDDLIVAPCRIDPSDFAPLAELGLPTPQFVHRQREL